jgi:hypothetical protein
MVVSDLIPVCLSALLAVFVVLTFLAIIMRLIILVFPEKPKDEDQALIAGITSTINRFYPNMQITKIEELK